MRTEPFAPETLSRDDFLGSLVRLFQPKHGYRAGIDPVLLAATLPAKAGQSVLELGCGAGPALCCLGVRVAGLDLHGLEVQPGYAALARRNLSENGLTGEIWQGDLRAMPEGLRQRSFDHVMANPPYFDASNRKPAQDEGREMALAGEAALHDWVSQAGRRCKPGGTVTLIHRAERLPEVLTAVQAHLGSLELWPLAPRTGRAPRLMLIRGRKAGRAPFRFHAPLILHQGTEHIADAEDYTPQVSAVLRSGAALPFPA